MKRNKKFPAPYATIQEEQGGFAVLYTSKGEYSVVYEVQNPVFRFSADAELYYEYNSAISSLIKMLGAGYAIQKHDIIAKVPFTVPEGDYSYLQNAYFRHFEGRAQKRIFSFITITQEMKGKFRYDAKKWKDFLDKVAKATDILSSAHFSPRLLNKSELTDFVHKYFFLNFKDKTFPYTNILSSNTHLKMGDLVVRSTSLVDIDEVDTPTQIAPYTRVSLGTSLIDTDLFGFLYEIPNVDIVVYHQAIYIPSQKVIIAKLRTKQNRYRSLPSPANLLSASDMAEAEIDQAQNNKLYVYLHNNIILGAKEDINPAINTLYSLASKYTGIRLSDNNVNQLELFTASLPGCAYWTNADYDRFLTMHDIAGCLQYKERTLGDEITPLKIYYTDRSGIPRAMDITGKEGSLSLTTNSNFFCLGPSGSGKSFHMNSVVRQLLEQNTEVIMVDTGNSYEGICGYFGGKYITYQEDKPISMNPFRISQDEYNNEKINFLKSLILTIWKQNTTPTTSEDEMIHRVISTYYRFYFTPFQEYTEQERQMRSTLLLEEARAQSKESISYRAIERKSIERKAASLKALANLGEGEEAQRAREKYEELIDKYDIRNESEALALIIKEEIKKEEETLRDIKVTELSFNSFYEFSLSYIPFLCSSTGVTFPIKEFTFLLSKFYKGGLFDKTLNEDMDSSLFDEQFIVFEIDNIKDDPILFPIVTLIIMDAFLQKMRLKKCRKALIIEEAWKAIASPSMAEFIKYLYKTARKHWGIVGVVTQEVEDIISSDIVKNAILNNSEVTILLDQNRLKDRFSEIQALLGLSDIECAKIWTINQLPPDPQRGMYKEVYIKRGHSGDVYGVEEPLECYLAYTTERVEKEAIKLYQSRKGGDIKLAIEAFIQDFKASGVRKIIDFSKQVMNR